MNFSNPIFRYDAEKVAAAAENPEKVSEDGIEDAFDVIGEVLAPYPS